MLDVVQRAAERAQDRTVLDRQRGRDKHEQRIRSANGVETGLEREDARRVARAGDERYPGAAGGHGRARMRLSSRSSADDDATRNDEAASAVTFGLCNVGHVGHRLSTKQTQQATYGKAETHTPRWCSRHASCGSCTHRLGIARASWATNARDAHYSSRRGGPSHKGLRDQRRLDWAKHRLQARRGLGAIGRRSTRDQRGLEAELESRRQGKSCLPCGRRAAEDRVRAN